MRFTEIRQQDYTLITLQNSAGMVLRLTSLGAAIREIVVPDREGRKKTVTLCPSDENVFRNGYYGKTIGRTAGRIKNAVFTLNGRTAVLEKNNYGTDNLHGGASGFHTQKFSYKINRLQDYTDVIFSYFSKDGEGGYFGNVKFSAVYRVYENSNTFRIIYRGASDECALLNVTNHVYLNMGGNLEESVKDQTLYLAAPEYGVLNQRLIVEEVASVPEEFDFRIPHKIGDYIYTDNVQKYTMGYDHPFFLKKDADLKCALQSDKSGIRLEIRTTYPCVVLYTNNYADASQEVYGGKKDGQYLAACLECQYHPDGIHSNPQNCGVVTPEKPYHEEVEYRFLTV